ncbi:MAG: hypothetical protein M3R13_11490 [Armatimonadota bacterium]|nr:hypothetical protein [Armatimonadota bacterium]
MAAGIGLPSRHVSRALRTAVDERAECDFLRGSGNAIVDGDVGKIWADFLAAELRRVPPSVELDELVHPVQIGLLGFEAKMALAHLFPRFVEELGDGTRSRWVSLVWVSLAAHCGTLPRLHDNKHKLRVHISFFASFVACERMQFGSMLENQSFDFTG